MSQTSFWRENRMFAILGATGKVGGTTIAALRQAGAPVRAVVRDPSKAAPLVALGCEPAVADLQDAAALARAIRGASAVQVICPRRGAS
jgi:NAD(P)H dehydrogenase (quinone)